MGWALENLGQGECSRIAETLFTVEKRYGAKLHGLCPVHEDSSASFVYHTEGDWCKCRGCGFGGDLVKLWAEVSGHDHQDIKGFKAEFGEGHGGGSSPRKGGGKKAKTAPVPEPDVFVDEAHFEALPPLPADVVQDLIKKRRWTEAAIKQADLRQFIAGGKFPKIAIPIRDDQGRLCNIRLYQPGAKQYKVISWSDPVCHACGAEWTKKNKQKLCSGCGALPIDYGRQRLLPPPSKWGKGILFLVEGESDYICALSQGLNAVTQTAGAGSWMLRADEFNPLFAGRDVVILYDADKPGFEGAALTAKSLADHAKLVRVLVWPEYMGEAE